MKKRAIKSSLTIKKLVYAHRKQTYRQSREKLCAQSHPTLCGPGTVARPAPLSMEFSRQEQWNELPSLTPGDLPDPRVETWSPVSLALAGRFFYRYCHLGNPREKGSGVNQELGLTAVHHYNRIDKQQGGTIYTGNYIQNPVITSNVKEFEKEYEYVRVCI